MFSDPAEYNGRIAAVDASRGSFGTVDHDLAAAACALVDITVHELFFVSSIDRTHGFGLLLEKFFLVFEFKFFRCERASAVVAHQFLCLRVKDQRTGTVFALCNQLLLLKSETDPQNLLEQLYHFRAFEEA